MQYEQTYNVTFPQGVNVRLSPDIKSPSLRIIPKGAQFKALEVFKAGDRIWTRTPANEYICIANGGNYYVETAQTSTPRTPSLDWAIAIDAWARERGYKGVKP